MRYFIYNGINYYTINKEKAVELAKKATEVTRAEWMEMKVAHREAYGSLSDFAKEI